jgi:predicted nucleic acid-binding protein
MLEQMPVDIDPFHRVVLRLPHLARKHGLTTYDAAYLQLALRAKLSLATADTMLKRAALAEGVALL